jgi:hypothetical protein
MKHKVSYLKKLEEAITSESYLLIGQDKKAITYGGFRVAWERFSKNVATKIQELKQLLERNPEEASKLVLSRLQK